MTGYDIILGFGSGSMGPREGTSAVFFLVITMVPLLRFYTYIYHAFSYTHIGGRVRRRFAAGMTSGGWICRIGTEHEGYTYATFLHLFGLGGSFAFVWVCTRIPRRWRRMMMIIRWVLLGIRGPR
ncbi:hypothetical protein VTJ04DRAFT_6647 [Mycothermus thermophilus]|uniref:uncharacterized protein n=1 Tax=Humicola insolens TaxID=85995 RepID=UPI003742004C